MQRCNICDKLDNTVKRVQNRDDLLCSDCKEEIRQTGLTYPVWEFNDDGMLGHMLTTQNVLNSGYKNRKTPRPTLKEPDFDLYKRGDDDV